MAAAPSTPPSSEPSEVRDEHLLFLSANFKEHLTNKTFSDITLVCGDQTFDCHKVILSSGCEYFRELLAENDLNLLDLSEVQAHVIQQVLFFIYTGACDITSDGIKDFLDITTKWKIPSLLRLCFKFMRENCTIRYAGVFYSLLRQYQDQPTREVVSYFIREHFTDMYSLQSFGSIPVSDFCDLLEHDEINVKTEDEVFDSLVELVEDQPADGEINARYDVIRFQHITKDYLEGSVRSHPLMREVPQRDLIRDAIRYKYGKSNVIPRVQRYWKTQQDILLERVNKLETDLQRIRPLFTKLRCIDDQKSLCAYSDNEEAWYEFKVKVQAFIDSGTSIGMYRSGFVLVGAYNKKFGKHVSYVDMSTSAQLKLPELPESIDSPGVVSVGDDLYVIGGESNDDGQTLDTVLKMSNATKQWTYMPRLQIPVKGPQCVLLNEVIYVLGQRSCNDDYGAYNPATPEPKMQYLKLNTNNWRLCKKIPEDCDPASDGFIVYDGQVVIVKYDAFLKFDPDTNMWTIDEYERPLHNRAITVMVHKGELCAYVGEDGWVMSYDADSNQWWPNIRYVPDLRRPRMLFTI